MTETPPRPFRPPPDDGAAHRYRLRVFFEDTDAGGIVYHANYLKFAERARTEMLRAAGIGQRALRRDEGLGFAVRRCAVDFHRPARLDDLLEVRTRLGAARGARLAAEQTIHLVAGDSGRAQDPHLVRIDITLACLGAGGRPVRLPPALRRALAAAGTG